MLPHRIDTGYFCDIIIYWLPSHHFTLLLHSESEGWFSSWPKKRREFFSSVNAFPVALVPVFYISNRNISRYLSCRWKNHERYKNTKSTKKKGILSMVHDMLPVSLQGTTLVTCCKSITKCDVIYSVKFYYYTITFSLLYRYYYCCSWVTACTNFCKLWACFWLH